MFPGQPPMGGVYNTSGGMETREAVPHEGVLRFVIHNASPSGSLSFCNTLIWRSPPPRPVTVVCALSFWAYGARLAGGQPFAVFAGVFGQWSVASGTPSPSASGG